MNEPYHYHHHDYGVGRFLKNGVVGFMILLGLWTLLVLVMSFPWIILASTVVVCATYLYVRHQNVKQLE